MTEAAPKQAGTVATGSLSPHAIAAQILDPQLPALRALARLRPQRVYADIVRCYALIAIGWALVIWTHAWWPLALACFLLIGSQQHALSIMVHEARHVHLLPRRATGDRLSRFVLSAPILHDAYHAEHHLWPFVPYYNLPALHRLAGPHPAIEVRHSYVGYLRAYFRRLPLDAQPIGRVWSQRGAVER